MSSIPKFLKNNDQEWKQWRAKKVIEHRDFISNLPKNYKSKRSGFTNSSSNIYMPRTKLPLQISSHRSNEVVIKITSSSKHFQSVSRHIDYVSRNGELQIVTSELQYYQGKDENIEVKKALKDYGATIPNQYQNKREIRQTYNIVFSMKEHSTTPPQKLKQAVFKTLKENYPDNFFSLVFHADTDNPHCHICLKISKADGTRIDIRKNDLAHLRTEFAKNLNDLGIQAKATHSKQVQQNIDLAKRQQILDSLQNKTQMKIKPHHYKVLDYGEAKFDFKDENNISFFVSYLTPKGDTTIWGKDLQRLVKELKIEKGEYVRFAKIGDRLEPYSFKKKIQNKDYEVHTQRKIPVWDASIANRAEKNFAKLAPVKITTELKEIKKERVRSGSTTRKYTKSEWARYYAAKRGGIHLANNAYNKGRATAKSTNDLQKLSKIPMVWKRSRDEMLLHANAQHKLELRGKKQSNHTLRRADIRANGVTKRGDKELIKAQKSNEREI
ncbi:spore coat protein CotH [Campylobacter sp. MIT 12-8780]|uniref:MobP1 family relaxase n=1 Tax=unclassified Campylobacter TaxID=2593542 RepID=UPI0010F54A2D|nr:MULTISPECIES: MobP1 family relaxase [unclassified Campylobacter]NDJ28053.1 relaxase/mobilization nuclease domain-containing protein [Campylobacter sp. MIT 19-121]TKX28280.1 spore coat protein CotH [Campylobacter sp. MIT 12-5580]TQR39978.1 spore coat protein CotH [Campylobacter sp. MIT 12-8780]